MDRRKRMHGKKRRSPAKMFAPMPQDPNAPKYNNQAEYMNGRGAIFKPQGEDQTNYDPDKQSRQWEKQLMAAQYRMREQMQSQQPRGGGGGGSHTHSVKVDGHSNSGGYQSPASAQVNPYKALNRGMFGSGLNSYDPTANIKTGTMAFMKKKLKKKK
jgi:hypothetical protein